MLLTGHSHQAWPDVARDAHLQAWDDAAESVDNKWSRAFEMADAVRAGYARLLDDDRGKTNGVGDIALGANTHELVVRLLSALPLLDRPRIVTTDGEFHTLRRQLARLEEEGIEVVRVAAQPASEVAARLSEAVDDRTSIVMVSCVLFGNAHIVEGLGEVQQACERSGAELLVDAYHALNAIPFSLREHGLDRAFVVGGGYKYCQLGEGNCFLRTPPECRLRPIITGWFAEFPDLTRSANENVGYADGPARFAGATYDPTSHYRGAAVFDFFEQLGLGPELLREVSQHQVELLASGFDDLDLDADLLTRDRSVALEKVGGFLALESPMASALAARLLERGVHCDHRGHILRLGPAPYLRDQQLTRAIEIVGEVVNESSPRR